MIVREFRNTWRRLVKRPGYTALSVGVLGVGLGVVLFLFSLINTVVLQPLPFPQAGRLMAIGEAHDDGDGIGDIDTDEYLGLHHLQGMDAVGAYVQAGLGLDTGSGARFYDGTLLTASMFHMLGVKPILGRGLAAADDKVGAPVVVLIGETLWRRQFHADRGVLDARCVSAASGRRSSVYCRPRSPFAMPASCGCRCNWVQACVRTSTWWQGSRPG